MDYAIEFEDGSTGYLSHHGVKGMHWGQRNDETLRKYSSNGKVSAKGFQKALNKTDERMRGDVIRMHNAKETYAKLSAKQQKAASKHNTDKVIKYGHDMAVAKKHYEAHAADYREAGKTQIKNLQRLKKSGYMWKSTPSNFMSSGEYIHGRELSKKYGKLRNRGSVNSASGNRYKVKESSKLSQKKKDKWSKKQKIQSNRPQTVYYY